MGLKLKREIWAGDRFVHPASRSKNKVSVSMRKEKRSGQNFQKDIH